MQLNVTSLLFFLISTTIAHAGLQVGAFAQNINPKDLPVSLNGGFADRLSKEFSDDLHARCLVIANEDQKLVLVIVDSCMLPTPIVQQMKAGIEKKLHIAPECILIAATHTHSAPTLAPTFQSMPNEKYIPQLISQVVEGVVTAHQRMVPAKIGFALMENSRQLFNRRWHRDKALIPANPFDGTEDIVQMNPGAKVPGLIRSAGPIDPQIAVLGAVDLKGEPIALFATYSLHYVGGNPHISADYFGAFADSVSMYLQAKPGFVAAMFNGTSGDVNNINFAELPAKRAPGEQIRLVANDVAQSAVKTWKSLMFEEKMPLQGKIKSLPLKVRKPSEKEILRAKQILTEAKTPLRSSREVYANETVNIAEYPDQFDLPVQWLQMGKVHLFAMPCEIFTEIGLELKAKSLSKHAFTISLANGYHGYLPTPAQHELGGYETWRARSSYLEKDASTKMVEALLELERSRK